MYLQIVQVAILILINSAMPSSMIGAFTVCVEPAVVPDPNVSDTYCSCSVTSFNSIIRHGCNNYKQSLSDSVATIA